MNDQFDLLLTLYAVGDRVQLCPVIGGVLQSATPGTVTAVGMRYLHVDIDGSTILVVPENIHRKVDQ